MELIPVPSTMSVKNESAQEADIIIEPCYPGYGITLGNALRRVLLSSMPGAAIVAMHIKKVPHEFTSIPGVKEDIVELMLNVKSIRVTLHSDEPQQMTLHVKGEKKVTAKDIKAPSTIEVVSTDAPIATLTDKNAELEITFTVEKGRGYVPAEMHHTSKQELGTIILDAKYSPVKNVNFTVEHVRVGELTNFDKVTLHVITDGTMKPVEAVSTASQILINHFSFLVSQAPKNEVIEEAPKTKKSKKSAAEE